MGTAEEIEGPLQRASHLLSGLCHIVLVSFDAARHPILGTAMRPDRAEAVRAYLQYQVTSRRPPLSAVVTVSDWSYVLIGAHPGELRASKDFFRLARVLMQPLLTPRSSGFKSGVPFWGTCASLEAQGPALRDAVVGAGSFSPSAFMEHLLATNAARPLNSIRGRPRASLTSGTDGSTTPALRRGATVIGSFPGSRRLQLVGEGENEQPALLEVADRRVPIGSHLDVWDTWVEVLPIVDVEDLLPTEDGHAYGGDLELIKVQRYLEPLISELWAHLDDLSSEQRALRDDLELTLIAANDAIRANDRSRLRAALLFLLALVTNIAAGVGANLIWSQFGPQIESFLDRLL